MIFYCADRSAETVNKNGHPAIVAFHVREARDGFVAEDPGHRERLTTKVAGPLCKQWYGVSLSMALAKGLI